MIITTYNQPEWLEKTLWGFAAQRDRDFELVIADDGSGADTRAVIDAARPRFGAPIRHVWHADQGFRKCEILNKAILTAAGDYLVFTDGDCVPRLDFIAVHRGLAEPRRFLSGGYVKLTMDVSRAIGRTDIESGRATSPRWLHQHGQPLSRRMLRLATGPRTAWLLDQITPTRPTFNGHNASVSKALAIEVNGFDERMGWGRLDGEFGERLERLGVRGKQVRHRASVLHLDHPRTYKRPEVIAANRRIRRENQAAGQLRAPVGLDRHLGTARA
ncbi:MAG: glycosyltransferase family 2 protein [Longimicrobiales bacterium]